MPACKTPHNVVVLAYDHLWPFEFGIAAEIFGWSRPELDVDWYDFEVAAVEPLIRSIGGLRLSTARGLEALTDAQTVIIPGWRDMTTPPPIKLLEALRTAAERGARILSYCTGTFVLAHAGLLDGRRAATHWRYIAQFREQFPDIEIVEDVLYVDETDIITSAGSSAAIDASLQVIRSDYGTDVANTVARSLVMAPHRDGGQSQYIEAPIQVRPGKSVAAVLDWARERLDKPISIKDMTTASNMSERTFLRRFKEGTGTTPLKWLRRERVHRAMGLLERTGMDLIDVSIQSGFGSIEGFRTAFRAEAGTSPAAYRKRFRGQHSTPSQNLAIPDGHAP